MAEQSKMDDARVDEQMSGQAATAEASQAVSQLPTPPESSTGTPPKVTIAPLPARLMNFIPPANYGMVERNTVYRSGFPQDKHLDFMGSLKIRSILKLVDTEPSESLHNFLDSNKVNRAHISIAANKDGMVKMTKESIAQAILFVSNPANYPVYIHCNQGKHRTGCVIACLRKCQGVPLNDVLEEYKTYAYPKERPGDVAFITAFDPQCLEHFATREELNERFPGSYRVDSKVDMSEFAPPALSAGSDLTQFSSGESDVSEDNMAMMLTMPHSQPVPGGVPFWTGEGGHPMIRDFAQQINGDSRANAGGSATIYAGSEEDGRMLLELCRAPSKEGEEGGGMVSVCPIRSSPSRPATRDGEAS